jgi:Family of unknown function (DUF6454)
MQKRMAGVTVALLLLAAASTAAATGVLTPAPPLQIVPKPAAPPPPAPTPLAGPRDEPLVSAFEQVTQATSGQANPAVWNQTKTIPDTWTPAGVDYEQEGLKFYQGRFYISVYDHTDNDGHLLILNGNGALIKDIAFVDGQRTHAGGFSVYGDYAYVPLAVDAPHTSADILRINVKTFQVTTLLTFNDHVGGVIYDPAAHLLVGQDWDSRTFYEWTLSGKQVAEWNNPTDYVGYQDCQYVAYNNMLCSGATEGATTIGGFDLIDLGNPEHPILNGVPTPHGGNANEILATPVAHGTQLTDYDASGGPINELTTVIPASH